MRKKAVSGTMFALLLTGMAALAFNIHAVLAFEVIYIMADGSIIPSTAPIVSDDNSTYTLTADITSTHTGIEVDRSNIIIDGNGHTIQGPEHLYGSHGIDLGIVNNVTIKNIEIKAFVSGIYVYSSSNNSIYANNIADNSVGISLEGHSNGPQSSMNNIFGNNITDNLTGVGLWYQSSDNNIYENNITSNSEFGIQLDRGRQYIYRNNIKNNPVGILFGDDTQAPIYHNNFVDNTEQIHNYYYSGAEKEGPYFWHNDVWDDGYPSGGNYWSDYVGLDVYSGPNQNEIGSDGIGDTPHALDEENQDNYPLMYPWGTLPPPPDINPPGIHIVSPENKTYSAEDIPLTFAVNESTSWIGYSLDGQSNETITGNTTLTASDGHHSLLLYANDTAGNMGSSNMVHFTIETPESETFPIEIVAVVGIVAVAGAVVIVYFTKFKK